MKKSFWINTLLAAGSIVFVFILLEIALTFIDFPPAKPFLQEFYGPDFKLMCFDRPLSSGYDIDLRNNALRAPYEAIFRQLNNNEFFQFWKDTPYAVKISFNRQGFREKEFAPKAPGKKRIVILGDSFTYGHGMADSLCYPRVMEKLLGEKCPAGHYEVLNLGVGNTGIGWIYRISPVVLKKLKPDILIYGYFFNDPMDKYIKLSPNISEAPNEGWPQAHKERNYFSLGRREKIRPYSFEMTRALFNSIQVHRETLDFYRKNHTPGEWAQTRKAIESINRSAQNQNCRFIVVLLPVISNMKDSPLADIHKYINTTMKKDNVEVVDCLPALSRFDDKMLYLHPKDKHPNALYHQTVAETIITKAGLCDLTPYSYTK